MGTHGLNEVQSFCEVFISGNLFLLSVADRYDKRMTQTKDRYLRNDLSIDNNIDRWNGFFRCYFTITDDYLYCNCAKIKRFLRNMEVLNCPS